MAKKRRPLRKRARREQRAELWEQLLRKARLWALGFFLLSMPIFFLPGNTEYGYTKTIYTLVFISALLLLWGVEGLLRRELELELTWLFPVVPAFVLVSLLSLTGGAAARLVLQSITVFLSFASVFLLVANTAREDRDVVLLLGSLVLAGVATGLFGLLQYMGLVPGGPGRGLGAIISTMGNRQFLAGFLSYLVLPAGVLLVRLRRPWARATALAAGGFVLAVMLVTRQVGVRFGLAVASAFLAFALGMWPARGARWPWWAAAWSTALLSLGLVGGWAWFLHGAALTAVCTAIWAWAVALRRHPWGWIPTAGIVVLALVLLIPVTTPIAAVRDLWERQSGAVRAYDWWVGYEMWRDQPLFGVGLSAYKVEFVPYKKPFLDGTHGEPYRALTIRPAAQAHNEYVQVAAELGTAGLLVLVAGLGGIAWLGLRRIVAQQDPEKRLELVLLGSGIVVTLVHAVVTFPWRLPASSLAFVTLLGLAFSHRYGPVGAWAVRLRGKALVGVVAAVALLGTAVSVIAVRDLLADRYLLQGRIALAQGDVAQAQDFLTRSVEMDFFPRVSLYWLGRAQLQAGELEAARDTLNQMFGRYVTEPVYLHLASAHFQLGEYREARSRLHELLDTHPPRDVHHDALYILAMIELRFADREAAEELLRKLLEGDRRHARAWGLLGEIARFRGDVQEAREHYEHALELIQARLVRLEARDGEALSLDELAKLRAEYHALQELQQGIRRSLGQLP